LKLLGFLTVILPLMVQPPPVQKQRPNISGKVQVGPVRVDWRR
jgi:hypothetical protein